MVKIAFYLIFLFSSLTYSQKNFQRLTLNKVNGEKTDLNQLSNDQILLISFWATWCEPCLDELSVFTALEETLKTTYNTKYIAISLDDSRSYSRVIPMINSKNWKFDIYMDKNQKSKYLFNILVIPHTMIVYKNQIIYEHSGFVKGDEKEIIYKLKELNFL